MCARRLDVGNQLEPQLGTGNLRHVDDEYMRTVMETDLEPVGRGTGAQGAPRSVVTTTDWRKALPTLRGERVTLRELRRSDAASLLAMLTSAEVARFIAPPPTTVDGFERFIDWTLLQRSRGAYVCFAVVPEGTDTAVGIFQVRQLDPSFATAEWGFAIGSPYWGTGVFANGAALTVNFAFQTLGVHRLEARAAVRNGRGNGALAKLGAVREGVLRKSFRRNGEYLDQILWSIVREDWMPTRDKAVWGSAIH
jgi:RimJ/RimL family protein N-acetyltransferase